MTNRLVCEHMFRLQQMDDSLRFMSVQLVLSINIHFVSELHYVTFIKCDFFYYFMLQNHWHCYIQGKMCSKQKITENSIDFSISYEKQNYAETFRGMKLAADIT